MKFAAVDSEKKISLLTAISSLSLNAGMKIGIAHFHEFGGVDGISPELMPACKRCRYCNRSYFSPAANYICKTGTMHFGGLVPCNGKMIPAVAAVAICFQI